MPAWYSAIGTAVHRWIEMYLKNEDERESPSIEYLFDEEILKLRAIEPNTDLWLHGGSNSSPVREERALKLAQDCVENAVKFLEDFTVWEIEPDITGNLPGCPVPIKAFPDLIGEHPKHGPVIVDWKTGKNKPKDADQLETYNCLMKHADMLHVSSPVLRDTELKGLWVMLNPDSAKARPVDLVKTPVEMGEIYGDLYDSITKGIFPTQHSKFMCNSYCDQAVNCKLQSGINKRTAYYDTPSEDGVYPF